MIVDYRSIPSLKRIQGWTYWRTHVRGLVAMSKSSQRPSPMANGNNPTCDSSTWLGSVLDIDIGANLQPNPAIYDVVGRMYRIGARANL